MKTHLLKFGLPVGMGLTLMVITIFGILSTTLTGCEPLGKKCKEGSLLGSDDKCYGNCQSGSVATYVAVGNCSAASAGGVYCCNSGGGGGGCTPTGCAASTPWLCGGLCYATVPSGNHSCRKCP